MKLLENIFWLFNAGLGIAMIIVVFGFLLFITIIGLIRGLSISSWLNSLNRRFDRR